MDMVRKWPHGYRAAGVVFFGDLGTAFNRNAVHCDEHRCEDKSWGSGRESPEHHGSSSADDTLEPLKEIPHTADGVRAEPGDY